MLPRWSTPAYRTTPNRNTGRFIAGSGGLSLFASSGVSLNERLRTRARLTNLAVGLILLTLALSIIANVSYWLTEPNPSNAISAGRAGKPKWKAQLDKLASMGGSSHASTSFTDSDAPLSIEATIDRQEGLRKLDHLVMVAGHAVWTG
jgi:hypothetical protein